MRINLERCWGVGGWVGVGERRAAERFKRVLRATGDWQSEFGEGLWEWRRGPDVRRLGEGFWDWRRGPDVRRRRQLCR